MSITKNLGKIGLAAVLATAPSAVETRQEGDNRCVVEFYDVSKPKVDAQVPGENGRFVRASYNPDMSLKIVGENGGIVQGSRELDNCIALANKDGKFVINIEVVNSELRRELVAGLRQEGLGEDVEIIFNKKTESAGSADVEDLNEK